MDANKTVNNHTLEDIIKDYREVFSFKDQFEHHYKRDKKGLNALNKLFDSNFKALYRKKEDIDNVRQKKNSLSWDGETMYLVTSNNKVVTLANSEWADFSLTRP